MEMKSSNYNFNSLAVTKGTIVIDLDFFVKLIKLIKTCRYYRSGLEMVRMANVYLKEGSLENAYILYMKFMTLFLEKMRKHPEYGSVPADVKSVNQTNLKEVMPKAEKLKQQLMDQFTKEHKLYQENEVCTLCVFISVKSRY